MPLFNPDSGGISIGDTVTSGTSGSVLFVGPGPVLAQDNGELFWDDTNNTLLIGQNTTPEPGAKISLFQDFSAPQQASSQLNAESASGGNYTPGDTTIYRIYAYKTILGTQYYSSTYSQTNSVTLSGSGSAFDVSWVDNTAGGSDGFLVIRDYNADGYASYYDAGATVSIIDDLDFSLSWTTGTPITTPNNIGFTYYNYTDGVNFWSTYGSAGYFEKIGINETTPSVKLEITDLNGTASIIKMNTTEHSSANPNDFSLYDSANHEVCGLAAWNGGGGTGGYGSVVVSGYGGAGIRLGEIGGKNQQNGYRLCDFIFQTGSAADKGEIVTLLGNGGGSFIYSQYIGPNGTGFAGISTAPTAKVHIAAGSATAGTAPIKLTTGALTTVAVAGQIEFLTNELYFTQTTNASRHPVAFQDNPLAQQILS